LISQDHQVTAVDGETPSSYLQFMTIAELKQLRVAERLQLVEDLWNTIAGEPSLISFSPEHKVQLDRRLDVLEAHPTQGTPWNIVRERILQSQ
jgi:putative addiction module component (TIGR02574 family)